MPAGNRPARDGGKAPRGRGFCFRPRRGGVPGALRARGDVLEAEGSAYGPRERLRGRLVGASARERQDVRGGREQEAGRRRGGDRRDRARERGAVRALEGKDRTVFPLRGASRRWRGTWRHRRDVDVARDANANNAKRIKGRRKSTQTLRTRMDSGPHSSMQSGPATGGTSRGARGSRDV